MIFDKTNKQKVLCTIYQKVLYKKYNFVFCVVNYCNFIARVVLFRKRSANEKIDKRRTIFAE